MSELDEHAILYNEAALTSLKRTQLVSLSKRYGLKANGKNAEMAQRLHDFGQGLTPAAKGLFDVAVANNTSPTKQTNGTRDGPEGPDMLTALAPKMPTQPSTRTLGRGSDAWEVIDTGDSSLVVEEPAPESDKEPESSASGSVGTRSWKSADNGAALDDFGNARHELRGVGSLRSLASSIKRTASRTLGSRHKDLRSPGPGTAFPGEEPHGQPGEEEGLFPPSPASTVGVPKRRAGTPSLHHRPSTIRIVSPSATATLKAVEARPVEEDEVLPFTDKHSIARLKGASMQPRRNMLPPVSMRNRRSLPALLSPTSSQPAKKGLYPELPPPCPSYLEEDDGMTGTPPRASSPGLPGSYPGTPRFTDTPPNPASPSFVFGAGNQVSSNQFSNIGAQLLQEMQAKMGGTFNTELLKGSHADLNKLVAVNNDLSKGSGGWGLSAGPSTADRFADAHAREFSRMSSLQSSTNLAASSSRPAAAKRKLDVGVSLSSKVNGLPAPPSVAETTEKRSPSADGERGLKRAKVSTKPKMFAALRGSRPPKSPSRPDITPAGRFKSNLRAGTEKGRFAFLRQKKATAAASPDSITSEGFVLASAPTLDDTPAPKKSTGPHKPSALSKSVGPSSKPVPTGSHSSSTRSGSTIPRRGALPDFGLPQPTYEPLKDHSSGTATSKVSAQSGASLRSKSSVTSLSRSSRAHDLASVASGTKSSMKSLSSSSSQMLDSSRNASTSSRATISRSSTLLAPTAASLARMQATVRPPTSPMPEASSFHPASQPSGASTPRPLPQPPKTSTPTTNPTPSLPVAKPFGEASSRTNLLFESNFHGLPASSTAKPAPSSASPSKLPVRSPRPLPKTPAVPTPTVSTLPPRQIQPPRQITATRAVASPRKPGRTPMKHGAAARRARTTGLAGVKHSGPDAHDREMIRRRSELRAKTERLTHERELRRMLG